MNEIRYFSMFSGVGGFEYGLSNNPQPQPKNERPEERGKWTTNEQGTLLHDRSYSAFTCVGMSEIDKYSSQVLKYRFPFIKNWGDCKSIKPEELPDFDMLCGGFPCQAFSIAGKRRGFEDTRGTMFFEVARILKVKRPKIVLLENVKGLLNHDKGETFRVILQTLDELGYEVQWMVLNSKFFGVPQNRERAFIVGSLRGEHRSQILPFGEINRKDITENELCHRRKLLQRNFSTAIQKEETKTISIRRLTPTECCRLQGFPDNWNEFGIDENGKKVKMSDTQRYKQMGNAVTTKVITAIARKLYESF